MPLLRVDRLAVVYGATELLTDLSFQVEPRQRLGIPGAYGSGKCNPPQAFPGESAPPPGSVHLPPRAESPALTPEAEQRLLDEPTTLLAWEAIEWREDFLRLSRAGVLIVSHDRRFLERTADDILELQAGTGEWYPGNYRQYLRLRRERRALRQKEYDAQQEYIARTEEFIRRYKAGQRAREARGRQTKLDRLDRVAPPSDDQQIRIRLRASGTSDLIFQSDGLTLSYASPASGGGSGWG